MYVELWDKSKRKIKPKQIDEDGESLKDKWHEEPPKNTLDQMRAIRIGNSTHLYLQNTLKKAKEYLGWVVC